jgi:hypothetical protein
MHCSNCDTAEALLACKECIESFCKECSEIHLKVKQYRNHCFEPFPNSITMCINCDTAPSKYCCLDCAPGENDFCNDCSVIHTKIKQFRGHRILSSNEKATHTKKSADSRTRTSKKSQATRILSVEMENNIGAVIDTLEKLVTTCYEEVFDADSFADYTFWRSLLGGLISIFIFYATSKALLGQFSTVLHVVMGGLILARMRQSRQKLNHMMNPLHQFRPDSSTSSSNVEQNREDFSLRNFPEDSISAEPHNIKKFSSRSYGSRPVCGLSTAKGSSNRLSSDDGLDKEFKDEFWYPLEGKAASFRPRKRPYVSRKKKKQAPLPDGELYSYGSVKSQDTRNNNGDRYQDETTSK